MDTRTRDRARGEVGKEKEYTGSATKTGKIASVFRKVMQGGPLTRRLGPGLGCMRLVPSSQ